jgi:hypothetical protein
MAAPLHIQLGMDLVLTRHHSRVTDRLPIIAVASACALLLGTGLYLLHAGLAAPQILLVTLPMALLVAGLLCAHKRSGYLLEIAVAAAFLVLGVLPWLGLPQEVWFGVVALPFAAGASHQIADRRGSGDFVVASVELSREMMLDSILLFAVAVSAGILLPSL